MKRETYRIGHQSVGMTETPKEKENHETHSGRRVKHKITIFERSLTMKMIVKVIE